MARKCNLPQAAEPMDVVPEEVTEIIDFHQEIMNMPKVNLKDPEAIRERINWYMEHCKRNHHRPFVEGLSAALKCSRFHLWDMSKEDTERGEVIRQAKALILSLLESWTAEGKLNPANSIFWLKNLGNYTDTVTLDATQYAAPKPTLSPAEIEQKLSEDVPVDPVGVVEIVDD